MSSPVQLHRAFRHKHVLPESANERLVSCAVEIFSNPRLVHRILARPRPCAEHHGFRQRRVSETCSRMPSRYAPSPLYAHHRECKPGALTNAATISPSFSIPINVPNVGIPAKLFGPVNRIDNQPRPRAAGPFAPLPPISSPSTSNGSHSPPRALAPSPLPSCPPASRAIHRASVQSADPLSENISAQSRPPRSQSPPAISRTLRCIWPSSCPKFFLSEN